MSDDQNPVLSAQQLLVQMEQAAADRVATALEKYKEAAQIDAEVSAQAAAFRKIMTDEGREVFIAKIRAVMLGHEDVDMTDNFKHATNECFLRFKDTLYSKSLGGKLEIAEGLVGYVVALGGGALALSHWSSLITIPIMAGGLAFAVWRVHPSVKPPFEPIYPFGWRMAQRHFLEKNDAVLREPFVDLWRVLLSPEQVNAAQASPVIKKAATSMGRGVDDAGVLLMRSLSATLCEPQMVRDMEEILQPALDACSVRTVQEWLIKPVRMASRARLLKHEGV